MDVGAADCDCSVRRSDLAAAAFRADAGSQSVEIGKFFNTNSICENSCNSCHNLVAERRRKLASYEVAGDDAKNNLSRRDNGKAAGNSVVLSGRNFNLRLTRHFVSG